MLESLNSDIQACFFFIKEKWNEYKCRAAPGNYFFIIIIVGAQLRFPMKIALLGNTIAPEILLALTTKLDLKSRRSVKSSQRIENKNIFEHKLLETSRHHKKHIKVHTYFFKIFYSIKCFYCSMQELYFVRTWLDLGKLFFYIKRKNKKNL